MVPPELNSCQIRRPLGSYVRNDKDTFRELAPSYPRKRAWEPVVMNVTGTIGGS